MVILRLSRMLFLRSGHNSRSRLRRSVALAVVSRCGTKQEKGSGKFDCMHPGDGVWKERYLGCTSVLVQVYARGDNTYRIKYWPPGPEFRDVHYTFMV